MLVRQDLGDLVQDGEATDAGVEDADGRGDVSLKGG